MKTKVITKQIIANIFYPLYRLNEILNCHTDIRVLLYHSIDNKTCPDSMGLRIKPDDFRKQMQSLKDWGYRVVSIYSIFDKLSFTEQPEKKVILTFDDGFKDFVNHVYPILEKFNYPATIFIVIDYLQGIKKGTKNAYWDSWDKMDWDDLRTIATNPRITFGSHGYGHNKITDLDRQDMIREIKDSKLFLEKELGRDIDFFTYPYGFFNCQCQEIVKEAGYRAAFIGRPGRLNSSASIYSLKRTEISRFDSSAFEFRKKLTGAYDWLNLRYILQDRFKG